MDHAANAKTADPAAQKRRLLELLKRVDELLVSMFEGERDLRDELDSLTSDRRRSGMNLVHYLVLRRNDLRELQSSLAELGLSSLGRSESHVAANLAAVRRALAALAGEPGTTGHPTTVTLHEGEAALLDNTRRLLGPDPDRRTTRIMVTLPSEAATDVALVRELVNAGMDVARINTAHDSPAEWEGMIRTLKDASRAASRPCLVLMDLPGPKVRTGEIEPGPRVVDWHPGRTQLGAVDRPVRVLLRAGDGAVSEPPPFDEQLSLARRFVEAARPGAVIQFRDARGVKRRLEIQEAGKGWSLALATRNAYVVPGVQFSFSLDGKEQRATVRDIPHLPAPIVLFEGDLLVLTADQAPGKAARRDASGRVLISARVPFTLPQALPLLRPGHRVLLDDGKAEGVVERAGAAETVVRITRSRPDGFRLAADKGVNLPDTPLDIPMLSAEDEATLAFVARNADMVGLSFVRRAEDVRQVQERLEALGSPHVGLVLKIETARAFQSLPELLLAALRSPSSGVMIARGDLAVEVGYERLAEVQEEILWLAEAAHTPVIWATQVLETLAKKGVPSRSEITDAAMGQRAECVMLNKGPYITLAARVLNDILRRMAEHQTKKRAMLRPLSVAQWFGES